MIKEIKKEYLKGKSKRYSQTKNLKLYNYVEEKITLDVPHKEKVYCLINNIIPKCKLCDNIPSFENFNVGFKTYCSISCQAKGEKSIQEKTNIVNIQKNVANLSIEEIIDGLYNKTLKIQKWRYIDKLSNFKNFKTLEQVYKHVILKDNQICKYCNNILDYDKKTREKRSCICLNKYEKAVIDYKNLSNKEFLEKVIENNIYLYTNGVNNKFKNEYYKRFDKISDDFMLQLDTNCKELDIHFSGYHSSISNGEKELLDFIKSFYTGNIIENDRHLGKELDIYLPDLKIAIEYDGVYWHSSKFKDKNYHLNKTKICEENDIQLIHIFETEWLNKKDIVKSILKAKLGYSNKKIYARKCIIKEISSKKSNRFLEMNHIQGKDNAPIRYGLFYKDELVQVVTFKRSHRSKDKYIELKRSATILNTTVVGGFSKLLKYSKSIIKEDIITFADRRYSKLDNIYLKTGMYLDTIKPNHFYINGDKLESREKYQKHKLEDILEVYDDNKTAMENCHNNGIFEIYDSGNYKYVL